MLDKIPLKAEECPEYQLIQLIMELELVIHRLEVPLKGSLSSEQVLFWGDKLDTSSLELFQTLSKLAEALSSTAHDLSSLSENQRAYIANARILYEMISNGSENPEIYLHYRRTLKDRDPRA